MHCPNCEKHLTIDDFEDTDPFSCEHCQELIELVIDESTYCGAQDKFLRIVDGRN